MQIHGKTDRLEPVVALIGYARVSTGDQKLALQHDALNAAGCERIFDGSVANMGHGRAASPSWGIRQHWRNAY